MAFRVHLPLRTIITEKRTVRTVRRPTRSSLAVSVVAAVCLSAACGGGSSPKSIRIGVVAPLEQFVGRQVQRGAELARDRINAAGGIRGVPLQLVLMSDSADAQRAVAVADRLYQDPSVVAVVGHANSGATLAAAMIYNRGLAAVSPTATSPEITDAGDWIFRIVSSDGANAARLADFALRELGRRAAILYADEPYGRGLRAGFRQAFEAAGGTLVEEYPYLEGETTDFEPYLRGIQAASADLIFVAGLDAGAGLIIRQARRMGLEASVLGGDGLAGLVGSDSVYDGTYLGLLYHPDMSNDSTARDFLEAYRAGYGETPDHFVALAYDAVNLVAQAIREAGPDRSAIHEYLKGVGTDTDPFRGVTGMIAFDANGDPVAKRYAVGRIEGAGIDLVRVEGGP